MVAEARHREHSGARRGQNDGAIGGWVGRTERCRSKRELRPDDCVLRAVTMFVSEPPLPIPPPEGIRPVGAITTSSMGLQRASIQRRKTIRVCVRTLREG